METLKKILVYGMTSNPGGLESYIMSMFRHMDRDAVQMDFLTDFEEIAYEEEIRAAGARIHKIPKKSKHPVAHLRAIGRILRAHPEYETVYFNILNAGAAFSMWPVRRKGRRIVAHSHNSSDGNLRLHRAFQTRLRRWADEKLACSEVAARFMFGDADVDAGRVTVIHNAIELENYRFDARIRQAKRAELGLGEQQLAVLHVGRISEQKNPHKVLDIMRALHEKAPDAVLLYVGTGEMEEEIRTRVRTEGMEGYVRFLGVRRDVAALMQAADAFLLPSLYDGLPIVLVEAQAADLPIAAADTISREARITDRLQYIALSAAPEAWAEAILQGQNDLRREDTTAQMCAAGYDIREEAKRLTGFLIAQQQDKMGAAEKK